MAKISELLPSLVDLEAFSHIELTEEETKLALLQGRMKKAAEIKSKEYRQRVYSEQTFPPISADYLMDGVKNIPDFVVDDFNKEIIWNLCLYFSKDVRCPLDFKKGILLYGGVGCGKTTLMHHFRHNATNSFALFSVRDISYEYSQHGADSILRYKGPLTSSDSRLTFGQNLIGVCFDDLGTEVDKKHYGNESNVMAEILLNRYDRKMDLFGKTHITTNLNTAHIEERYGSRVRSRLRELVNILIFKDQAPDRRK